MTIKSIILCIPLLIVGWLSTLMTVNLFSDNAPAQLVLFPSSRFLKTLPSDITIVSIEELSVTLQSTKPNFVKTLYQHGAIMVLPAGLQGCSPSKT